MSLKIEQKYLKTNPMLLDYILRVCGDLSSQFPGFNRCRMDLIDRIVILDDRFKKFFMVAPVDNYFAGF